MLTRGDDYPVHQTAEPIAQVATGDRNVYDRYFFNGYSRDGELFFAAALFLAGRNRVSSSPVGIDFLFHGDSLPCRSAKCSSSSSSRQISS